MKKTILVMGVLLLFSINVSAISLTEKGVKVGLNFSKMTGDDMVFSYEGDSQTYEWKFGAGYTVGGFITFSITDKFMFQPELLYSYKTVKMKDIDSKLKLKYYTIPVLLKYNFQPEGKIRPTLFLGPYAAFKNKARMLIDSATYAFVLGEASKGDDEIDIKNFKRTDFGFIFGAGTEYAMKYGVLNFEVRYSIGLNSVTTDKKTGWNLLDENGEGMDLKINDLTFLLGFAF